jgi:hypothetical protein
MLAGKPRWILAARRSVARVRTGAPPDERPLPKFFRHYATRRRVDWSVEGCEFYPVPGATTCSSPRPPWTCTRCILRLSLVWCTARGSRWWASESSSGTSATCRERPLFASATVRPSALPAPPLDDSTTEAIPTGYSGQLLPYTESFAATWRFLYGPRSIGAACSASSSTPSLSRFPQKATGPGETAPACRSRWQHRRR